MAKTETIFVRNKSICKMHKARCRANNYYWDKLYEKYKLEKNNKRGSKKFLYFIMDDNAVEYCNYSSKDTDGKVTDEDTITKGIEFARNNFFTPVLLHSKNKENLNYLNFNNLKVHNKIDIYNHNIKDFFKGGKSIPVFENGLIEPIDNCNNSILLIDSSTLMNCDSSFLKL